MRFDPNGELRRQGLDRARDLREAGYRLLRAAGHVLHLAARMGLDLRRPGLRRLEDREGLVGDHARRAAGRVPGVDCGQAALARRVAHILHSGMLADQRGWNKAGRSGRIADDPQRS
jgi:hypothetical protein